MPRLFTALEVPADIAFSLSLLRGGLPGARWVEPENYHVTLRFIGDVDGATADEVADALKLISRPRFETALEGLSAFGGRKPHMKGVGEPEVAAYLSLRAGFRTAPFPVGRFVLLSSRASKGGGPYLVEEAYPLAA